MPPLNGNGSSTSVFDTQLAEDFIEVVLHCVSADPKDDSDLLVRFALANPFSDLLLARTEMILAKRPLVLALFVHKQEKTPSIWTAAKAHCQPTKSTGEGPSRRRFPILCDRVFAKPCNDEIMERSGQQARGFGLGPRVARDQAPCRFAAISHLSMFVQENVASTKNAFDRCKKGGLVTALKEPIHVYVKSDDSHAFAPVENWSCTARNAER